MRFSLYNLILSTALLIVTPTGVFAETRDAEKFFFQENFGDFPEEMSIAKEQGKIGIMMMFEQDECPFCFRMRTTILNQKDVQEYFRKHFSIFHIDIEGDTEMVDFDGNTMPEKDFAFKINRVRATPVLMFYNLEGKKIARHTGPTADKDELLLLGRYVIEEHYKKMSFNRYKQQTNL